jgi:cyanate permease
MLESVSRGFWGAALQADDETRSVVSALGPGLVGLIRSWSDGYEVALALWIMLELVAAVIVLVGYQKQVTATTR